MEKQEIYNETDDIKESEDVDEDNDNLEKEYCIHT